MTNNRILTGAKYFKGLKPSQFILVGGMHPKIWHQFQAFLDLIIVENTPPKDPHQLAKDMTDDELIEIFQ